MKKFLRLSFFVLLLGLFAAAQTAVVKRNTNLRSDASTENDPIELLTPGTVLQLLETDKTDGYFHVQVPDGQEGFVWARNVRLQAPPPATPTPTPLPSPTSTPTPNASPTPSASPSPTPADLFSQLMGARKAATGQPLVINGMEICGPEGDATDPAAQALNDTKNRTDLPALSDYVVISWDDLKNLPSDRVEDFQGAPVVVTGFLSHQVKVETGGESTNCHKHAPAQVDWHMYLTQAPAQGIADAIIVETTPRTRPNHKWTTNSVSAFVDSQTPVRISGWLMFDFEHVDVVGTQRATVWEVHPITRIEVQQNGQWVDLDQ